MAKLQLVLRTRGKELKPRYTHHGQPMVADSITYPNTALLDPSEFERMVQWAQNHVRTLFEEAREIELKREQELARKAKNSGLSDRNQV